MPNILDAHAFLISWIFGFNDARFYQGVQLLKITTVVGKMKNHVFEVSRD